MSFTESNTVEQMILDAATTLGSGVGSSVVREAFGPRISRMNTDGKQPGHFLSVASVKSVVPLPPMSFTESNTVEQMILDAATAPGSGTGSSVRREAFGPRISRMNTDGIEAMPFLSVLIRAIRGFNFFHP